MKCNGQLSTDEVMVYKQQEREYLPILGSDPTQINPLISFSWCYTVHFIALFMGSLVADVAPGL